MGDDVVLGSLQPPKKPLDWHVVVDELIGDVTVAVGLAELLWLVVVVSSLHPNQPGVLQVDVVVVVVLLLVVVPDVMVVSSRHPHQPGVLQVSVRVLVLLALVEVVVALLLFPVTSFQSGQS